MSPIPESLRAALADQYRLDRLLGEGGMATVFLAHDLKHDRPVALKLLRPELANDLGPERFEREVRLAARLQHPHILTVLDSGETDGRLWFTMPFVEGETLRDRLDRERQLPVDAAVRIAREAADALDYAHRHGVVHRDIKPENILLTDGHALVADFGIARGLTGESERLTGTGLALGTAAYMSPEQASGDSSLDGRSDVYSLAIVLYEMLSGETPFAAATPQATIARRFTDTPRPLRELRQSVPAHVEAAVQQALARTTADRFETARGFEAALSANTTAVNTTAGSAASGGGTSGSNTSGSADAGARAQAEGGRAARTRRTIPRSFAILAVGVAIGSGLLFGWHRFSADDGAASSGSAVASRAVRVAVLPFDNIGDSSDAYFADGVTDAVRGKLAGVPNLEVIARASSIQYRESALSPRDIAAELGVTHLLTGAVRWSRQADGTSRVQVRPELVELNSSGAQVRWSEPFDAPLTDVFQVQGDIAARVTRALRLALTAGDEAQLARVPTHNPAAYDAYLRGEAAWSGGMDTTLPALRQALAHFDHAVALDSSFVDAWIGIAAVAPYIFANSTPTPEIAERARIASERAVELDPNSAAAHRVLGMYHSTVRRDQERALEQYETAYRLAPTDVLALSSLARVNVTVGQYDEALRYAEAAYALDPRSPRAARSVATVAQWLRRLPVARAATDRLLALEPGNLVAIHLSTALHLAEGDMPAAREVLATAERAVSPSELAVYMALYWDFGWVLSNEAQQLVLAQGPEAFDGDHASWGIVRAQLYDWRGDQQQSRAWADTAARVFAEQIREAPDDPQLPVLRALALGYLGRRDEAHAMAERSLELMRAFPDSYSDPYFIHQIVRMHLKLGEFEQALDYLEPLLERPYYLTPALLRVDPDFRPLQGNPRFERLASAR